MVEKVSRNSNGQKFIKQYYLNQVELNNFVEQCRMVGIRVEMSGSIGDDAFMPSGTQFNVARPPVDLNTRNYALMNDPASSYRSTSNVRTANNAPLRTGGAEPMAMNSNEGFVDFNADNFGSCMYGGGVNINGKFSSR